MRAPRPRWMKVMSDLWGNRARSLLVVASITVGLFAIGVIATIYAVIAADMRTSYQAANPANVYLQADLYNKDLLSALRDVKGVRDVMGVRAVSLRYLDRRGEWKPIDLKAYSDPEELNLNRLNLAAGTWPPGNGEIVIDQHKYNDLRVPLGAMVTIERPSGKTRELKLVGIVQDVTIGAFSGGGGFFDASMQGFVTRDTMDLLEQASPELLSGVYLTADDGENPQAIQSVADRAVDALEAGGVDVTSNTTRLSTDHPNSYLVNAIIGVLLVLGLLVVFLSGFLITNTLQALLNQQILQIGIMKTVGARWMQIAGVYVILIFGFGGIAYALAAPLSFTVSFALLKLLAGQLNFVLQGERVIWPVALLQAGLAAAMPQLSAWLPIWKGTRISVQEALSGIRKVDLRKLRGKKGPVKQTGLAQAAPVESAAADDPTRRENGKHKLHRPRFFTRPMLISLRNTFRRKGRLTLTLTTLTLGGAVFIATFNAQSSVNKYIDQIGQYFLADVNITLDRPYRTAEIDELLGQVPGVGRVEGWAAARVELIMEDGRVGERVNLLAPPPDSALIKPVMLSGRWIEPGDENAIVLNEVFTSNFPNLRIGDPIKLKVNGENTIWTVVGFYRFAGKNGGYSAYTGFDYLTRLTNTAFKAINFQVVANRSDLTAREQDDLAKAVSAELEKAGIKISDITTGAYLKNIAGGGFQVLTYFLLFLAILTALVGSIGLAGTMSMNVLERTREIGVMRAIGASDKILMRMVIFEGLLIGGISYLAGVILSFPISKLMADGITLAIFEAPSSFGFSLIGFLIWLAVVVVLSLVASYMPARNAARLTIREVLAYE